MIYRDFPVISHVVVHQVIYGDGVYLPQVTSTASPSIASFYRDITRSKYFDWLSEYNTLVTGGTNQVIRRGSFEGQYLISPSDANNGAWITDTQVRAEIVAQINAGHLPQPTFDASGYPTSLYAVNFRNGQHICIDNGPCSLVPGGFCAYHGATALDEQTVTGEFFCSVHPDLGGLGRPCGPGTDFQNTMAAASHELLEAVTDPIVGFGWFDFYSGEIGDPCAHQDSPMTFADGQYTVQKVWSNRQNACIVTAPVTTDFGLSLSSPSLEVRAGDSTTVRVTSLAISGMPEKVTLNASNVPGGSTAAFGQSLLIADGGSTDLTISTGSARPGQYSLSILGTSGNLSRTLTLPISITPQPQDFGVSVGGVSQWAPRTTRTSVTIETSPLTPTKGTIAFATPGLPTGVSADFTPAGVTPGNPTTLTLTIAPDAPLGPADVYVVGALGSVTHELLLHLWIQPNPAQGLTKSDFQTGGLDPWSAIGQATLLSTADCHTGGQCAMLGARSIVPGDATLAQSFVAPAGAGALSLWYQQGCQDASGRNGLTITLQDRITAGVATVLPQQCQTTGWQNITAPIVAGHVYTLIVTNHDDDAAGAWTLLDDVVIPVWSSH
jgi:hypothetical protein